MNNGDISTKSRMDADPLSLLRLYTVSGKDIIEKGEKITFGELSWFRTVKTRYIMSRSGWNDKSETKDYYSLETLLFLVKHKELSHPNYVRLAAAADYVIVKRADRDDVLAYLHGKINKSTSIDLSEPVVPPMWMKATVDFVKSSVLNLESSRGEKTEPIVLTDGEKKQNVNVVKPGSNDVRPGTNEVLCITLNEGGEEQSVNVETTEVKSVTCINLDGKEEHARDSPCSTTLDERVTAEEFDIQKDAEKSSNNATCTLNGEQEAFKTQVNAEEKKVDEVVTLPKHLNVIVNEEDNTDSSVSEDCVTTVSVTVPSDMQEVTLEPLEPSKIATYATSGEEKIVSDVECNGGEGDLAEIPCNASDSEKEEEQAMDTSNDFVTATIVEMDQDCQSTKSELTTDGSSSSTLSLSQRSQNEINTGSTVMEGLPLGKPRKSGRVVKPGTTYKCSCCTEAQTTKLSETGKSKNNSLNKQKYPCNTCGKGFPSRSKLDRHQVVHSKPRPFQCRTCNTDFKSWANWSKHLKSKIHIRLQNLKQNSSQRQLSEAQQPVSDNNDTMSFSENSNASSSLLTLVNSIPSTLGKSTVLTNKRNCLTSTFTKDMNSTDIIPLIPSNRDSVNLADDMKQTSRVRPPSDSTTKASIPSTPTRECSTSTGPVSMLIPPASSTSAPVSMKKPPSATTVLPQPRFPVVDLSFATGLPSSSNSSPYPASMYSDNAESPSVRDESKHAQQKSSSFIPNPNSFKDAFRTFPTPLGYYYTTPFGNTQAAFYNGLLPTNFQPGYNSYYPFTCADCNAGFMNDVELRFHLQNSHPSRCYKCPICTKVVLSPDELLKCHQSHQ